MFSKKTERNKYYIIMLWKDTGLGEQVIFASWKHFLLWREWYWFF